ncbi:rCG63399 [Rattus norvegicus]|uniref:RCG63399 n=1 Tax=Rattus norvegicus TaxID=10116 RepID=A6J5Z4_RAT|nr:rCG63399 [Rattus norvegicus]
MFNSRRVSYVSLSVGSFRTTRCRLNSLKVLILRGCFFPRSWALNHKTMFKW